MKNTHSMKMGWWAKGIAPALLLAAGGLAAHGQSSPVGIWDCIISGKEQGIAYITFANDFTLSGYQSLIPKPTNKNSSDNPRGGSPTTRNDSTADSTSGTTSLVGFTLLSGNWSYDSKGNVNGFYSENGNSTTCVTNLVATSYVITYTTNIGGQDVTVSATNYVTNAVVDCSVADIANGVSFTAKVKPGQRIQIKAKSAYGNTTLKGVPAGLVTDITGQQFNDEVKRGDSESYFEFITNLPPYAISNLIPSLSTLPNVWPGIGSGAGYSFLSLTLISSQNKISIVSFGNETNVPITAVIGKFNPNSAKSSLKGSDENGDKVTTKVTRQ